MTEEGLRLLKQFEGFRMEAYRCAAGVWTIGYGNTQYEDGSKVKEGDKITKEEAERLLLLKVEEFEGAIKIALKDNKTVLPPVCISALTLLAYNIGITAFFKSTLYKVLRKDANDLKGIEQQWLRWNKAGGKVLAGLSKRREQEYDMYRRGILSRYTDYEKKQKFGL